MRLLWLAPSLVNTRQPNVAGRDTSKISKVSIIPIRPLTTLSPQNIQNGHYQRRYVSLRPALQLVIAELLTLRYSFTHGVLIDRTPLPENIPKVAEVGATSGPLHSAAYFIGARCAPYNEDYMLCKHEAKGRGELDCMKEGRRVTRCAASVYVSTTRRGGMPLACYAVAPGRRTWT